MPDRRRVIVTSRPIRNDETVYLKLCGTGGVRIGITDLPHYADGDIAEFNGYILFKDKVFEKSVKRTIQKACDGENHVLVYHDEFGAENELMQRKLIPSELVIKTLFLFCEIKFGDIRIAFESRDGNSMTYMSTYADQIRFDDNKDAMLTNTTGGIIISDIELKIDKPMRIILKANQWAGNFIIRYGLTNISPAETTEETLKLYTIANEQNRNGKLDRNIPTWFKTCEVRTDAFTGSFTFCITKDNEIQTNINSDCETRNMVPFVYTYEKGILVHSGPDLQKPVWLVLEVFECDVRIELQHEHGEPRGKNEETNTCYTFTHDFGNADAMQYIMEYQNSTIKEELTKVCSNIKWRKGGEVQFIQSCTCNDKDACKHVWAEQSMRVFSSFIERIVIFKRHFDKSVWEQVTDAVDAVESIGIKISKDGDKKEIEMVGLEDDQTFTKLLSTIDAIKPPVSMTIDISAVEKLRVLEKVGIVSEIENELHVKIVPTEKGCQVTGSQPNVSVAKDKLFKEISMIQEYNCDLSNESFEDFLQTPTVQCKIRDQLHVFNLDNNLELKVKDHKLFVWCRKPDLNKNIAQAIFEIITHKFYHIEGDASENSDVLEANILEVQERVNPYARISYTIDESGVEISITCLDGFMDTLIDEITTAVESCLIKDMIIPITEYIARYINDHLMDELKLNLKAENVSDVHIKHQHNSLIVRTTLGSHETVLSVVLSLVKQVHMEWLAYTERGIDVYLSEEEGIDLVSSFGNQSDIQVLTQYEMKNSFVHAAALVNSGAVIFASKFLFHFQNLLFVFRVDKCHLYFNFVICNYSVRLHH